MGEPSPLDPRSREPLEASRVDPVWRKARARARSASRMRAVGIAGVAVAMLAGVLVFGVRREQTLDVVAEAGASWKRGGNTIVITSGKVRVGAPGDVVVVSTPQM